MTHRIRLALALAATAIVPLAVLGVGVRREMTGGLERQMRRRAEALVGVLRADVASERERLRVRLRALAHGLAGESRFRLAARGDGGDRRWLLDWAGEAMTASGLAVLRLEDASGRILSSGHFRNEFDRVEPGPWETIRGAPLALALIRFPTPVSDALVLASAESLTVADRSYRLVGGLAFDSARARALVPPEEMTVALELGPAPAGDPSAAIVFPYYDAAGGAGAGQARLVVVPNPAPLKAVRREVDRWLLLAAGLTLALAALLAAVLGRRVSRPLEELARMTSRLDLDRLDQDFRSARDDEIGALSNLLADMTARLRSSAARLLDAERRAATGDLARQVNHDIKNGLAPIRHVVRHLRETASRDPGRLALVFAERQGTIDSSLTYLEGLAQQYARLAPATDRTPTPLEPLLADLAAGSQTEGVTLEVRVAPGLPAVSADGIVLRRILENLIRNGIEAIEQRPGRVTVAAERAGPGDQAGIRVVVSDTGRGMSAAELERAFEDFHTTRPGGTGLGLSVVRRLVGDLGGRLAVETSPGGGSRFTVELPSA